MKSVILIGSVKKIVKDTDNYIAFVFTDNQIGEVLCHATRGETDLYFNIKESSELKLEVILKGFTKLSKTGMKYTINILEVKTYEENQLEEKYEK